MCRLALMRRSGNPQEDWMRRFALGVLLVGLLAAPAAGAAAQTAPVPGPGPATACSVDRYHASIRVGATCEGSLNSATANPVTGKRGDIWGFDGRQNQCVEVTMTSGTLDSY